MRTVSDKLIYIEDGQIGKKKWLTLERSDKANHRHIIIFYTPTNDRI